MRVITSFICALILVVATTVYAAPVITDNQILSEKDVVAVTPEEVALPTGTIVEQVGTPQPGQIKTVPQGGQLPTVGTVAQESSSVVGLRAQSPTFSQEQPNITDSPTQLSVPSQEIANVVGSIEGNIEQSLSGSTDRLAVLEAQGIKMQAQLTQLNERIGLVEERLIGNVGGQKTSECFYSKIHKDISQLQDRIGHKLFAIIVSSAIVIFFLFLVYMVFPRRRNNLSVCHYHEDSLSKGDDFNPMEGQEGAIAKLNLARVYIEMGKESKAQGVLYDVLAHGNEVEQEEAKTLLAKIEHPTSADHQ
jgi:FimV-like protein